MYKGQCMINSMMLHSFQDNAGIRQLAEVLKICWHMYFCCCWFLKMVSFSYVLVFLSFLHDNNKFYMISFLGKHNFFIGEKHTQWMLDTKIKVFHESISCFMKWPWSCISWNALKEKFHSVSFPLQFLRPLITLS